MEQRCQVTPKQTVFWVNHKCCLYKGRSGTASEIKGKDRTINVLYVCSGLNNKWTWLWQKQEILTEINTQKLSDIYLNIWNNIVVDKKRGCDICSIFFFYLATDTVRLDFRDHLIFKAIYEKCTDAKGLNTSTPNWEFVSRSLIKYVHQRYTLLTDSTTPNPFAANAFRDLLWQYTFLILSILFFTDIITLSVSIALTWHSCLYVIPT